MLVPGGTVTPGGGADGFGAATSVFVPQPAIPTHRHHRTATTEIRFITFDLQLSVVLNRPVPGSGRARPDPLGMAVSEDGVEALAVYPVAGLVCGNVVE